MPSVSAVTTANSQIYDYNNSTFKSNNKIFNGLRDILQAEVLIFSFFTYTWNNILSIYTLKFYY